LWERKERIERRRNVVVKGYKGGEGDVGVRIRKIFEQIGAKVKVEEVREVKAGRRKCGGLAVIKLRSEEDRKELEEEKRVETGGYLDRG
jgi:S-adenosylhomocysteine hydrolase